MFVEIRRHFELGYTERQKKHAETCSERCGAIDTSNASGKGNEQCEPPDSDVTLALLWCFHMLMVSGEFQSVLLQCRFCLGGTIIRYQKRFRKGHFSRENIGFHQVPALHWPSIDVEADFAV